MSDDQEVQKLLRSALEEMPAAIESGLLNPKASASSRLNWVNSPSGSFKIPRAGQSPTPIPKTKAAQLLKAAVPALEKIHDEHQSARLRSAAAQYLLLIANKVG